MADVTSGDSTDTLQGTRRTGVARWVRVVLLALAVVVILFQAGCSSVGMDASPTLTSASDGTHPMFGAYTDGGVWQGMQPVQQLETLLGRKLDVVQWFMSWGTPYDVALVESASADGRRPLITWEPNQQSVAAIAAGTYDGIIRDFADGVRATPGLVYVRPFPEMNGDWEAWNGDPAALVEAWRHMANVFRAEGADNVRWVWSPNVTDEPNTPANAMERYYPGDAYVDVLALDGYNWGTTTSWSTWQSFEQIFARPYARITALGPQPVWITEVASSSQGGDKAAWVANMLDTPAFPRIQALIWFNQNKETDWRIDNSTAVVQAARFNLGPATTTVASR